jgi:hypothetical protein
MNPRPARLSRLLAWAIGASSAYLADELTTRRLRDRRLLIAATGLVAAAAVYPISHRRAIIDWPEAVALVTAGGVALNAVTRPGGRSRLLLGVGWTVHALFDAAADHSSATYRLPRWYPALCAGFDIVYGARLIMRRER